MVASEMFSKTIKELWTTSTVADRAREAFLDNDLEGVLGYLLVALGGTAAFITLLALILIYAERKVSAHFQCRLGPMRVGWHGILQSVADALKLLFKEDTVNKKADRVLHLLAPGVCLLATVLALVVIPMSPWLQIADLNIGIVYLAGVSGFGVLGILLGGWSSHSKWSLLGAMRAGAQMISYEVSAILSLLIVALFSQSLSLTKIVQSQAEGWWIWRGHVVSLVAFIAFMVASVAELHRTPFDLAEGESELTAGFHTEYSGLRFGFFFLAEFMNMFVVAAVAATLFLGGWMPFHIGDWLGFNQAMDVIPPGLWFFLKVSFLIFLMMWFRWTFPRLRIDQLMKLEWKILLPIGFVNLVFGALVILFQIYFFPH